MIENKLDFVYLEDDRAVIFEDKKDIGVATGERLLQIIGFVNTACSKYGVDFECLEECLKDFDEFLEDEYNSRLCGYVKGDDDEWN